MGFKVMLQNEAGNQLYSKWIRDLYLSAPFPVYLKYISIFSLLCAGKKNWDKSPSFSEIVREPLFLDTSKTYDT